MRLSKITGIAVAVAFAAGLATTGTALAVRSGTQIEYNARDASEAAASARSFIVKFVLIETFASIGL